MQRCICSALVLLVFTSFCLAVFESNDAGAPSMQGSTAEPMPLSASMHCGRAPQVIAENMSVSEGNHVPGEILVKFKGDAGIRVEEAFAQAMSPAPISLSSSLDQLNQRYAVKRIAPLFPGFRADRQRQQELLTQAQTQLTAKQRRIVRRLERTPQKAPAPNLDWICKLQVQLQPGQTLAEVAEHYRQDPDVEYAELNYRVSIDKVPNDAFYELMWSLHNIGQIYPESERFRTPPGLEDSDIDAPEAWTLHTGSESVVVAVIDTGLDVNHPDLRDNLWVNAVEANGQAGVDDDQNGYVDDIHGYDFVHDSGHLIDDHGHGTHCAGTIAAQGDNGRDIVGVCWDAGVMGLKFLTKDGSGNADDAALALYYAIDNGADVLSNSWGGGEFSETLAQVMDYAHSQGVVVVAAAGNSFTDEPHYPAAYDHVIAVAATDSADEKALFSNYGPWVDIAAPGVDILSLRATGTALGTVYTASTTIASGTSMACPHVAGAAALLLSVNGQLAPQDVADILTSTVDPIAEGISSSNGRLNVARAALGALPSKGYVQFDRPAYGCDDLIKVFLVDYDLHGQGVQFVEVVTANQAQAIVTLTETETQTGVYMGTLRTRNVGDPAQPNTIAVVHGESITVTYEDQDDGAGSSATVIHSAQIDCVPPQIIAHQVDAVGPQPTVISETNEPTTMRIVWRAVAGDPCEQSATDFVVDTDHAVSLKGILPATTYRYLLEATDAAGNVTVDDNGGLLYFFITDAPHDIYVPTDYATIQAAIDHSWNAGRVIVADGVYTGPGNRDIEFDGKVITVQSMNGPEHCIIDCQGSQAEPHRGFLFQHEESDASILDGFTIRNGYAAEGGGVYVDLAAPTIRRCIIEKNFASEGGGIYGSLGFISRCIIRQNVAKDGGGLSACDGVITDCLIAGNLAENGSGLYNCNGAINHCTIAENLSTTWTCVRYCNGVISNSILWGNQPVDDTISDSSPPLFSCVQPGTDATGSIDRDPLFVSAGTWDDGGTPDDATDDIWSAGDYRLQAGSACLDSGQYTYCMDRIGTDLDGMCRFAGEQVDMGCCEFQSSADDDGDWLSNDDELAWQTDPERADSDGDGRLDGVEVLLGSQAWVCDDPCDWQVPGDVASVQAALFFARDFETIELQPGTYRENLYFGTRQVTLTSTDPCAPDVVGATVIDADTDQDPSTTNARVLTFLLPTDPNCRIAGLTLTGGRALRGGALWGGGQQTRLEQCVVTRNQSQRGGGGICFFVGAIDDCVISHNSGGHGGGLIWCYGVIKNTAIVDNDADWSGGAGYDIGGVIDHCGIRFNEAATGGALVFGDAEIQHSWISQNVARTDGGGVYSHYGQLRNCFVTGNVARSRSGAFHECLNQVVNCTVTGNRAPIAAGGLWSNGGAIIQNSILAQNTDFEGSEQDAYMFADAQLVHHSCIQDDAGLSPIGVGNLNTNPLFVANGYWDDNSTPTDPDDDVWHEGDYHLQSTGWRWDTDRDVWTWDDATSPCVDAGAPGSPLGGELLTVPDDPENNWGANVKVNMGAYGGAVEASMGPLGWSVLSDLNNDGVADQRDYALLALDYLLVAEHLPGDLDRDGEIDLGDLAVFAQEWLATTSWFVP